MMLYDEYVISEIRVTDHVKKMTVRDLHLNKYDLRLVALEMSPNKILLDFTEDTSLKKEGIMAVIGKFANVEAL